jgi:hypothetical protein
MVPIKRIICLVFAAIVLVSKLTAQTTSTVFSPDVDLGESEFEYRVGFDPEGNAFAHRIHYQYGFSESWRMRLIASQRASDTRDLEFRYLRWEGMWQFLEDQEAGWDSAIRLEAQLAEGDDLPSRLRVGWTSKFALNEQWQLRAILMAGREVGEASRDGLMPEFRGQISRKLSSSFTLAIDLLSDFNRAGSIGSFEEQEHLLGPLLKFKLDNGWSGTIGYLHGISRSAPDDTFRFSLILSL